MGSFVLVEFIEFALKSLLIKIEEAIGG